VADDHFMEGDFFGTASVADAKLVFGVSAPDSRCSYSYSVAVSLVGSGVWAGSYLGGDVQGRL